MIELSVEELKLKLFDAEETNGKLMWFKTAYSDQQKHVHSMRDLLSKIEKDYDHQWPNEDRLTSIYRNQTLKEIQKYAKS